MREGPDTKQFERDRWTSQPMLAMSVLVVALVSVGLSSNRLMTASAAAADSATIVSPSPAAASEARAIFAGGCFWCSEADFEKVAGVLDVRSGYTGGSEKNPTYKEVAGGKTGHTEAVEVRYDPAQVSYAELLDIYWRSIDPTVRDRQFCDVGRQYRTAIFVAGASEKQLAESSKARVAGELGKPVFTEIQTATKFYPAEKYHQDYYRKNPLRYKYYRSSCGRDRRLREIWGDPKPQ
jgi:peptide-methionine (S)-S-oxide reductase